MDVVATVNPWTTGRSPEHGGAGDSGDLTAVGVHHGLKAVAEHLWGTPSLAGRRVAIAGVVCSAIGLLGCIGWILLLGAVATVGVS